MDFIKQLDGILTKPFDLTDLIYNPAAQMVKADIFFPSRRNRILLLYFPFKSNGTSLSLNKEHLERRLHASV